MGVEGRKSQNLIPPEPYPDPRTPRAHGPMTPDKDYRRRWDPGTLRKWGRESDGPRHTKREESRLRSEQKGGVSP